VYAVAVTGAAGPLRDAGSRSGQRLPAGTADLRRAGRLSPRDFHTPDPARAAEPGARQVREPAVFDRLVLTIEDIQASVSFYTRVPGTTETTFAGSRKTLVSGSTKINLHRAGQEFEPKAVGPTLGSADLCLISMADRPARFGFLGAV
jgi:hypothetical protein